MDRKHAICVQANFSNNRVALLARVRNIVSALRNSKILHYPIRANSGEPNGSAAPGLPILDRMSDDLKADAVEQRCIFVRAQAGVIERVAPILPNAFSMGWPAIEHQDGRWRGVSSEHVEHPTLVVWSQVKKAIPSKHAVELTGKL
jgi:hypothetical protein